MSAWDYAETYDDDVFSDWSTPCEACDEEGDDLRDTPDGLLCRGCALRGCPDDMCHGQGWCMHR